MARYETPILKKAKNSRNVRAKRGQEKSVGNNKTGPNQCNKYLYESDVTETANDGYEDCNDSEDDIEVSELIRKALVKAPPGSFNENLIDQSVSAINLAGGLSRAEASSDGTVKLEKSAVKPTVSLLSTIMKMLRDNPAKVADFLSSFLSFNSERDESIRVNNHVSPRGYGCGSNGGTIPDGNSKGKSTQRPSFQQEGRQEGFQRQPNRLRRGGLGGVRGRHGNSNPCTHPNPRSKSTPKESSWQGNHYFRKEESHPPGEEEGILQKEEGAQSSSKSQQGPDGPKTFLGYNRLAYYANHHGDLQEERIAKGQHVFPESLSGSSSIQQC